MVQRKYTQASRRRQGECRSAHSNKLYRLSDVEKFHWWWGTGKGHVHDLHSIESTARSTPFRIRYGGPHLLAYARRSGQVYTYDSVDDESVWSPRWQVFGAHPHVLWNGGSECAVLHGKWSRRCLGKSSFGTRVVWWARKRTQLLTYHIKSLSIPGGHVSCWRPGWTRMFYSHSAESCETREYALG